MTLLSKERSVHRREYHSKFKYQIPIIIVLLVLMILLAVYSLSVNNFKVTFGEACEVIINRIKGVEPEGYIGRMIDYVVVEVDAPRAIGAIAIGTTLAICGAVMQSVTHNPLSEPYTIGISSAAMFGVTISVAMGISLIPGLDKDTATGVNAFIFAMVPAMIIVGITSFKKLSPNMMILVGIGMMYLFSSITTLIKFNASEEALHEIYIWGLGTLSKVNWTNVVPLVVTALIMIVSFTFLASKINILGSGDRVAQSLGVNPVVLRVICFSLVSIGVAVVVRYTGTIGFVGLVAPHITRLFMGNNNKLLIPVSAIAGSMLILVGDIIVRMLPGGLPAGVITALIGSPMFLYFLFKNRMKNNF